MACLVFWYGTDEDNMGDAFSFIARKSTISYEEGCDKYLAIPPKIKAKLDKNKSLTQSETLRMNGLEEIKRDYKLPAAKRVPWLFDFEEEYEMDDDVDSEQDDEDDEIVKEPEPKKKKKKKEPIDEGEEEDTKKVTKKKIKRKRQSDPKPQDPKKKKKVATRKLDEEIMEEVAQEEAFFQEDAPSDDDKGDDDFSVDKEESDSDDEDELYEEKPKKETKSKANKAPKPSKGKAAKEKIVNKKSKTDKKDKIRISLEEEQSTFESCENVFLPLIFKLNKDNVETEKVEKYLRKILDNVELLTPSFIQESQIGMLIKKLRKRVKEDDKMNSLCKTITAKMKTVYSEKLDLVPTGFTPKLSETFVKVMVSRIQYILFHAL
jgi:hypothetical protein